MKKTALKNRAVFIMFLLLLCTDLLASGDIPIADVHIHYNIDQAEVTDTEDALKQLNENNVLFGVISSKPPAMALELVEAAGGWIIPFYMPYLEPDRKRDWYFDKRVLPASREALESGRFKGLGEISPDEFKHFIGPDIRLQPVRMKKDDDLKEILSFYMGKNTPERKEYIMNNLV